MIHVTHATDIHLAEIIALQRLNLPQNLTPEAQREQGFVTVEHSLELLKSMNDIHAHAIALDDDKVVGYALAMDRSFRHDIPFLIPLFERIDGYLKTKTTNPTFNYIIMGQVCIDKDYRSLGLFHKMYYNLCERLSDSFEIIFTEVADKNQRSIRAHRKVGFQSIQKYMHEGEEWHTMEWRWIESKEVK